MGHNWKAIVNNHFPGRTALQARNQYNQFCRRTGLDTQPSTPGSTESPATFLPMSRALSHASPARTKSRRADLQNMPTDTDLRYEGSDDNPSSENDKDDDDEDDEDWPQSEDCSQWKPPNEASLMQARQSPFHQYAISPHEIESLRSPLPSDGVVPVSYFDPLFPDQSQDALGGGGPAFEQASDQPYIDSQV